MFGAISPLYYGGHQSRHLKPLPTTPAPAQLPSARPFTTDRLVGSALEPHDSGLPSSIERISWLWGCVQDFPRDTSACSYSGEAGGLMDKQAALYQRLKSSCNAPWAASPARRACVRPGQPGASPSHSFAPWRGSSLAQSAEKEWL